ncbi:MAG: hypothetical protein J7M25_09895 [Deltaproteobacteria bacterium]|nr:hypothetical protein [Deltaproteobacteria bacterium]
MMLAGLANQAEMTGSRQQVHPVSIRFLQEGQVAMVGLERSRRAIKVRIPTRTPRAVAAVVLGGYG